VNNDDIDTFLPGCRIPQTVCHPFFEPPTELAVPGDDSYVARKTGVIKRMFRQELTKQGIHQMEKRRSKKQEMENQIMPGEGRVI